MKIPKSWVGKKQQTNLELKAKHIARIEKRKIQHTIERSDWEKQLKEYHVSKSV